MSNISQHRALSLPAFHAHPAAEAGVEGAPHAQLLPEAMCRLVSHLQERQARGNDRAADLQMRGDGQAAAAFARAGPMAPDLVARWNRVSEQCENFKLALRMGARGLDRAIHLHSTQSSLHVRDGGMWQIFMKPQLEKANAALQEFACLPVLSDAPPNEASAKAACAKAQEVLDLSETCRMQLLSPNVRDDRDIPANQNLVLRDSFKAVILEAKRICAELSALVAEPAMDAAAPAEGQPHDRAGEAALDLPQGAAQQLAKEVSDQFNAIERSVNFASVAEELCQPGAPWTEDTLILVLKDAHAWIDTSADLCPREEGQPPTNGLRSACLPPVPGGEDLAQVVEAAVHVSSISHLHATIPDQDAPFMLDLSHLPAGDALHLVFDCPDSARGQILLPAHREVRVYSASGCVVPQMMVRQPSLEGERQYALGSR